MKILCRATVFFLFGWQGLSAQQNLSQMRVSFETGTTSATEAVQKFLSENIKEYNYSSDDLKGYKVQSVKCKSEPVIDCLNKLLKGIPAEAIIYNNSVIIRQKKMKSISADIEPPILPIVKADSLRPKSNINKIDEIVLNTGYYKVSEKERTGNIAKVSAKDIENQPVTNVLASIQGRISGVSITQNSGVPGGGFDIQIRGQNSLRTNSGTGLDGNMPLYIVDGMPLSNALNEFSRTSLSAIPGGRMNPLNSINPNDIESFEVLKDADATAIYGSKGANGVILITTKKGKMGQMRLNFTTNYGISEALSNLKLMNKDQYLQMRRQAYANEGMTSYPANAYDLNGTWNPIHETNWIKTLIGNKATSSYSQLSISGGSETTNFSVSLGHNQQSTAFGRGFEYISNTINSNLSHRSKDSRFSLSLSNMFTDQRNNVVKTEMTSQAYSLAPISPPLYNADGSLNWANNTFINPLAAFNATYNNDSKLYQTSVNTEYKLHKDIRVKINAGLNYIAVDEIALMPNTMYNPALANGASSASSQTEKRNQKIFSFIVEPQLSWSKNWQRHQIEFLVGGTFQRTVKDTDEMTGIGFESNQFNTNIAAAKIILIGDQSSIEYKYAALFGRLNYQYKKRYILNLTGRRDGSSRFGPQNRFANFAALGAAWIFTQENLFKDHPWLSFGKLRGSYGTAGSDNIGDFQFLDNYTVSTSLNYNNSNGLTPSRLYNPSYSWEITRKVETALELGFFKNRLNLNIAWYQNRSSNQLVGYQLSGVTGFSSIMANLNATVQNTGLELELNAKPITTKNFQWQSAFNITFPKNKLLSFPGLEGSSYANQYAIGYSTQIVKLYQLEGVNPQTHQYQFTDFNNDGKISASDDNKIIKELGIKFFGGISNTFQYRYWDFSFLLQFVKQNKRNYNAALKLPGGMTNQPIQLLDVWSENNPNGLYMPYRITDIAGSNSLFRSSTATVSDASFIRIKNIQLSYCLPLKDSIFREVRIYLQAQNLVTWSKFFGIDPETFSSSALPPSRTYLFGAQFNL